MSVVSYPARALRALGLLLADSALTVWRGKTFWAVSQVLSYGLFWPMWCHAWPKNNANKVPSLKTIKFGQNCHFWSFWARPYWLIWCPIGWLVGGCGARALSRKTHIYFNEIHEKCPIFWDSQPGSDKDFLRASDKMFQWIDSPQRLEGQRWRTEEAFRSLSWSTLVRTSTEMAARSDRITRGTDSHR